MLVRLAGCESVTDTSDSEARTVAPLALPLRPGNSTLNVTPAARAAQPDPEPGPEGPTGRVRVTPDPAWTRESVTVTVRQHCDSDWHWQSGDCMLRLLYIMICTIMRQCCQPK